MKQSELKAILKDHRLWLESGGKQGKRAILEGANLQDANLQGADLGGANLQGASLLDASLWGANLGGAHLRGADLRAAYLGGANLRGADLGGAKFTTNFKKVGWFTNAIFSEDQIPWVVLHPNYPKWADTLKWVKAEAEAA
jgi:uncharacterized protein YjbI with pentapeptide repeats